MSERPKGEREPSIGRRWRAILALAGLLALVVAAERARWFAALLAAPAVGRTWIWSADPPRRVEPLAFFAARDVELASVPRSAELEVLGDPEYLVYLNGARVGSGRPAAPPEIDRYEVAPLLKVGTNRIVLELRSPTGSGAATVRLADDTGRVLAASDCEWVVYRSAWSGLLAGEPFFPTGRVALLARSPFGRWAEAAPGPVRPRFDQALSGELVPAVAVRSAPSEPWRRLRPSPSRKQHLGGRIEIDLGSEVTGYVQLGFDRRAPARGLLRCESESAAPRDRDPEVVVLSPANRGSWQDAVPRRCRYLELIGVEEVSRVGVLPISASAFARLGAEPVSIGLLGAPAFPVRLPVVDEIWRRYGLSSSAQPPSPAAVAADPELRPDGATRKKARARERDGRRRPAGR